jgi:hypothetical protein
MGGSLVQEAITLYLDHSSAKPEECPGSRVSTAADRGTPVMGEPLKAKRLSGQKARQDNKDGGKKVRKA